jgi:hypothetical protein
VVSDWWWDHESDCGNHAHRWGAADWLWDLACLQVEDCGWDHFDPGWVGSGGITFPGEFSSVTLKERIQVHSWLGSVHIQRRRLIWMKNWSMLK